MGRGRRSWTALLVLAVLSLPAYAEEREATEKSGEQKYTVTPSTYAAAHEGQGGDG